MGWFSLETIVSFFGSSVFLGLLGIFYRIGCFQTQMEMGFKRIDEKFIAIDEKFAKIDMDFREIKKEIIFIRTEMSNLDKQIAVIAATLRFNGFDLDRHKAAGE